MKKHFIAFVFSFIGLVAYAQGNYSETRTVGNFDKISSCCGIEVVIDEGESSSILIETNRDNILQKIKTEVVDGELRIRTTGTNWNKPKNLKIKVSVKANKLSGVDASSGAYIYTTGNLRADKIIIDAGSGGSINVTLKANSIQCDSGSGSIIKLEGTANNIKAHAGSGSAIDAKKLTSENADLSASSGASVKAAVTEELKAKASSGGSIVYYGDPKQRDRNQSSGGTVRKG